jgi:hypothetical protein
MSRNDQEPSGEKRDITPGLVARWLLPFVVSVGVLALTFAMNWQPWFGYAALIAGALGSLMYAGRSLGIGEG